MRIGLQVPYFTWPGGAQRIGDDFAGIAKRAEDAGFASLWVMDHFFQLPGLGAADLDMLEAYTALGFAAGCTSRIKLGTMVTGNTYRNPGVLVKAVTTLDVLSGGRAYFGVGAGWFEREHDAFGIRFGTFTERFEKLEETLRITRQMWSDDNGAFEGKHYQMKETICTPQPVSAPRPPILIGGRGEKKTLRFVAKYADAWNMGTSVDENGAGDFRRLSGVLREHCQREGRPYDAIEKTTLGTLWLSKDGGERWVTPEQAIERFALLREAGVDQAIVNVPNVERPETLEMFASTIISAVVKL